MPKSVVTHQAPMQLPQQSDWLTFAFVADAIQQCLQLNLADELHTDIMPVLLGQGLRVFVKPNDPPVQLEKIKLLETAA